MKQGMVKCGNYMKKICQGLNGKGQSGGSNLAHMLKRAFQVKRSVSLKDVSCSHWLHGAETWKHMQTARPRIYTSSGHEFARVHEHSSCSSIIKNESAQKFTNHISMNSSLNLHHESSIYFL